jgi:hypothetical protein
VQWAKGTITDFKPSTNEHTVVYDINTPDESYEEVILGWVLVAAVSLSTSVLCRPTNSYVQ